MSQRKKKLKVKMQLSSASNEHLASLKWLNSPHIDELLCLAFNPPPPPPHPPLTLRKIPV